jgi:hypothetical protein
MLERRLSGSSLVTIARMGAIGAMLKAVYRRYPEMPMELGGWMRRTGLLWRRAESVKRKYFERG